MADLSQLDMKVGVEAEWLKPPAQHIHLHVHTSPGADAKARRKVKQLREEVRIMGESTLDRLNKIQTGVRTVQAKIDTTQETFSAKLAEMQTQIDELKDTNPDIAAKQQEILDELKGAADDLDSTFPAGENGEQLGNVIEAARRSTAEAMGFTTTDKQKVTDPASPTTKEQDMNAQGRTAEAAAAHVNMTGIKNPESTEPAIGKTMPDALKGMPGIDPAVDPTPVNNGADRLSGGATPTANSASGGISPNENKHGEGAKVGD